MGLIGITLLIIALFGIIVAKDKYIKIENIYQCANSENDPVKIWYAGGNTKFLKNRARFNASFTVLRKIVGDLQLILDFNRCSVETSKCAPYTKVIINRICYKWKQEFMFWSEYIKAFQPPLSCPMFGNYSVVNKEVDLTVPLTLLPGNQRWLGYFKFLEQKSRDVALCFIVQAVTTDRRDVAKKNNMNTE